MRDHELKYPSYVELLFERGCESLLRFEQHGRIEDIVASAALLRLAIEARLLQHIEAEASMNGVALSRRERRQYEATKLRSHLLRLNPKAAQPSKVMLGGVDLGYTPVSDVLASLHGQLGELLHLNHYHQSRPWHWAGGTLDECRAFTSPAAALVRKAIEELRRALGGTVLAFRAREEARPEQ